jgi:tRNA threonylcarbamoyladenosine biosynthesis protein TsaB
VTPLILAVDTTREYGSLALARGSELIGVMGLHSVTGFSTTLFGHMQELLAGHGVTLREIDCFAAASGPGSFTGVRVGLSAVKGLAEALGKPAVAVSNLEAVARFGSGWLRAPLLDARRGDVYGGLYDDAGRPVAGELVAKLDVWRGTLPEGVTYISPDDFAAALPHVPFVRAPQALAGVVAQIAAERYARGEALDPVALDANYVRRSDAELFWKE